MQKRAIAAMLLAATAATAAQTDTKTGPEKYTGTIANMESGSGSKIAIQIFQWSSDTDRQRVLQTLSSNEEKKPDELTKALAALPTIGYIWASGPAGYALKYAHRLAEPGGAERVVVMTDRPLGSLEHPAWKISGQTAEPVKPYTVVELQLDAKGRGRGKMSLTTPVTTDEATKAISVTNYDSAPTLLMDVQRQPKS
jgi:hypothetical protein